MALAAGTLSCLWKAFVVKCDPGWGGGLGAPHTHDVQSASGLLKPLTRWGALL